MFWDHHVHLEIQLKIGIRTGTDGKNTDMTLTEMSAVTISSRPTIYLCVRLHVVWRRWLANNDLVWRTTRGWQPLHSQGLRPWTSQSLWAEQRRRRSSCPLRQ